MLACRSEAGQTVDPDALPERVPSLAGAVLGGVVGLGTTVLGGRPLRDTARDLPVRLEARPQQLHFLVPALQLEHPILELLGRVLRTTGDEVGAISGLREDASTFLSRHLRRNRDAADDNDEQPHAYPHEGSISHACGRGCYQAPRRRSTAGIVFSMIDRSRKTDQRSRHRKSSRTSSSKSSSERPETCHRPVIPGSTR